MYHQLFINIEKLNNSCVLRFLLIRAPPSTHYQPCKRHVTRGPTAAPAGGVPQHRDYGSGYATHKAHPHERTCACSRRAHGRATDTVMRWWGIHRRRESVRDACLVRRLGAFAHADVRNTYSLLRHVPESVCACLHVRLHQIRAWVHVRVRARAITPNMCLGACARARTCDYTRYVPGCVCASSHVRFHQLCVHVLSLAQNFRRMVASQAAPPPPRPPKNM